MLNTKMPQQPIAPKPISIEENFLRPYNYNQQQNPLLNNSMTNANNLKPLSIYSPSKFKNHMPQSLLNNVKKDEVASSNKSQVGE